MDEFHDTNRLQCRLAELAAGANPNVCAQNAERHTPIAPGFHMDRNLTGAESCNRARSILEHFGINPERCQVIMEPTYPTTGFGNQDA